MEPLVYKFSVEQAYLGVTGSEIEISTGRGGGDCGVTFQTGTRYLVYAYRYKNQLTTSICTRTKTFDKAAEDVAFLGTLSSAAPGVTISGSLTYHPDERRANVKGLGPDVLITIEGESEKKEIRPDARGEFRVTGLAPGKYKLTLRLPETLATERNEAELNLSDRGCGDVWWTIYDNGRINGRVVDADGLPVANILVSLVEPGADIKDYPIKLERTETDGSFSFSSVPRGSYQIAVNQSEWVEPKDPSSAYPSSFYPGVVDRRHAKTIDVGVGERLSNIEIRIASKPPASVLSGRVVWSDGAPVPNAKLSVEDMTYRNNSGYHVVAADEQGRFEFNGYTGQQLVIEARSSSESKERTEKLSIKLERPTHNVRIVITKLP